MLAVIVVLTVLCGIAEGQQQPVPKFYRPPRFTPPVHAAPGSGPASPARAAVARQVEAGQAVPGGYPVRWAAWEEPGSPATASPANDLYVNEARQAVPATPDQWQTRTPGSAPQTGDSFNELSMPDTEIPASQFVNSGSRQSWQTPGPVQEDGTNPVWTTGPGEPAAVPTIRSESRYQTMPEFGTDAPPAMEDYATDPFAAEQNDIPDPESGAGRSVLVRDEAWQTAAPPASERGTGQENQLRNLQVEPQRLRDQRAGTPRKPFRNTVDTGYRNRQEEMRSGQDDLLDNTTGQAGLKKSCDDYRDELLNAPITDIILDVAPLRPSAAAQKTPEGLTRSWTDCEGNILGTGTLVGVQQSYIVVETDMGQRSLIPAWRLSDADVQIVTEYWGLPDECSLGCDPYAGRNWLPQGVFWKASALCHKPLYFENHRLERYGHTHGPIVEPVASTVHFFSSLILWPYNTGIHPPNECLYSLGFYRPGDCAPWLKEPFPVSLQGAGRQAIAVGIVGGIIP
jgi:hypothetical protein